MAIERCDKQNDLKALDKMRKMARGVIKRQNCKKVRDSFEPERSNHRVTSSRSHVSFNDSFGTDEDMRDWPDMAVKEEKKTGSIVLDNSSKKLIRQNDFGLGRLGLSMRKENDFTFKVRVCSSLNTLLY